MTRVPQKRARVPAPQTPSKGKKRMGHRKYEARVSDDSWFKRRLKQAGLSQAQLARQISADTARLSRALRGMEKLDAEYVVAIAEILGTSIDEVLKRAGYAVASTGAPVVGRIRDGAQVSPVTRGTAQTVPYGAAEPGTVATIVDATEGRLKDYNGAAVCYNPDHRELVEDVLGKLCVIEADDMLVPIIGTPYPKGKGLCVHTFKNRKVIDVHVVHSVVRVKSILFNTT